MRSILNALTVMAIVALIGGPASIAQEVEATVSLNADQLPASLRDEVSGFAEDLKSYIGSTRFTGLQWEGERLRMNFSVVLTGVEDGKLKAKILVGSQRAINDANSLSPMMKILDDGWVFPYVRNQPFQHDPSRYDELTGLIDFYVYVALGLDLDSYNYLDGAAMYEKAREIMQRAQNRGTGGPWSTQTRAGAYSRYGLVRELTDMRFHPLRKFIFDYHYNGLDILAENRETARDSINGFLTDLVKTVNKIVEPSVLVRVLTDAKNVELSELFVGYRDPMVWRKLSYLDPGHQTVYEAARDR